VHARYTKSRNYENLPQSISIDKILGVGAIMFLGDKCFDHGAFYILITTLINCRHNILAVLIFYCKSNHAQFYKIINKNCFLAEFLNLIPKRLISPTRTVFLIRDRLSNVIKHLRLYVHKTTQK